MTLDQLFSVSLILMYYHRIWYFPVRGVKRGLHVSKETEGYQAGGMKKGRERED